MRTGVRLQAHNVFSHPLVRPSPCPPLAIRACLQMGLPAIRWKLGVWLPTCRREGGGRMEGRRVVRPRETQATGAAPAPAQPSAASFSLLPSLDLSQSCRLP